MRRNVEVSAKKAAECEAKAQQIVETFIDPVEDEADFLSQLRWINQDHYQCITEERAIAKTCGYPLCEEKLVNIPGKKYQICTIKNKVYDLTERKNFCSNQCYKSSCYLKQQLFVTPLWARELENEPKFMLLKNLTELAGEEIHFGIERVALSELETFAGKTENEKSKSTESGPDQSFRSSEVSTRCPPAGANIDPDLSFPRDDSAHSEAERSLLMSSAASRDSCSSLKCDLVTDSNVGRRSINVPDKCDGSDTDNSCHNNVRDENHSPHQPVVASTKNTSEVSSISAGIQKDSRQNNPMKNRSKISNYYSTRPKNIEPKTNPVEPPSPPCKENVPGSSSLVLRVEKSLREWFTIDTLAYLLGAEAVKQLMLEKGRLFEAKELAKSDPYIYERYSAICKKLKILELEEDKYQNDVKTFEKPTKPLPDFATLKEQAQEMEIKVRAFYRGDKKVTFDQNRDENDESDPSVVLPPLHQYAQIAIRRNIVLNKLKTILPDLAMMLGFRTIDLSDKVKQLALTCTFAAHNVTFKPLEWNLIALILIKLLSLQDVTVRKRLHEKANYVNVLLMSYQLESNYLDLLCTWLMDLDQILTNENEPS